MQATVMVTATIKVKLTVKGEDSINKVTERVAHVAKEIISAGLRAAQYTYEQDRSRKGYSNELDAPKLDDLENMRVEPGTVTITI